jgi:hypothetical protein
MNQIGAYNVRSVGSNPLRVLSMTSASVELYCSGSNSSRPQDVITCLHMMRACI